MSLAFSTFLDGDWGSLTNGLGKSWIRDILLEGVYPAFVIFFFVVCYF